MSFMHFGSVDAASVTGGNVTLSGGTVYHFGFKSANGGFEWRADGTVWSDSNGIKNQLFASTDWIIPHEEASADYFIRTHTTQQSVGSAFRTGTSIDDTTWNDLSATRNVKYRLLDPEFDVEDDDITFIVEIRYLDGSNVTINNQISTFDGGRIMDFGNYEIQLVT